MASPNHESFYILDAERISNNPNGSGITENSLLGPQATWPGFTYKLHSTYKAPDYYTRNTVGPSRSHLPIMDKSQNTREANTLVIVV